MGSIVELHSLKKAELNGLTGKILSMNDSRQRYVVLVLPKEEEATAIEKWTHKAIRPRNVRLQEPQAEAQKKVEMLEKQWENEWMRRRDRDMLKKAKERQMRGRFRNYMIMP